MKEAQRKKSEEITAPQEPIPQSHSSTESQRTLQKSDENEPEWQEFCKILKLPFPVRLEKF